MSNDLTTQDDGFGQSSRPTRSRQYAKWDDTEGWRDRDGCPLPEVLLLVGIDLHLKRWTKDETGKNVPTIIDSKPLPDLDELNNAIPFAEWPIGLNNTPEPPYKRHAGFTLVDPVTGAVFYFSNSTIGALMLYDDMNERVTNMRAMRGVKCFPVVKPSQRQWKSKKWGLIDRPHFEIIDWKTPGGSGNADRPVPQIISPNAAEPTAQPVTPETAAKSTTSEKKPAPKVKKPIPLSDYTLAVMGDVKKPTTEEEMNDEIPF